MVLGAQKRGIAGKTEWKKVICGGDEDRGTVSPTQRKKRRGRQGPISTDGDMLGKKPGWGDTNSTFLVGKTDLKPQCPGRIKRNGQAFQTFWGKKIIVRSSF